MLLPLLLNNLLATPAVPVTVPDVVGQPQAAGTATLVGSGFAVAVATAYSSTVPLGTIISQSPLGGASAASGSTVTITVSLGAADAQGSGGWWPEYGHVRTKREKRKRELEELEREQESIADEQAREIARLMRAQEIKDAERVDLERLQKLADTYATRVPDLPKNVRLAILNAQDARTKNSLEQMRRIVEQTEDDEMLLAIQQVLLLITD